MAATSYDPSDGTLFQADGPVETDLMAAQTVDAPLLINPGPVADQADRLGRADVDAVQTAGASGRDDLRGQDELAGYIGI